jgi:orotidine-5'-phosphate decarboxylase
MGLDPMLDYVPESLRRVSRVEHDDLAEAAGAAITQFNFQLIDAVADIIPAIKPQFAYYEQYGAPGYRALQRTIEYARSKGLLVIADAKRNDIGSTAEAYSRAILGETDLGSERETASPFKEGHPVLQAFLGADCITLNGYLGYDGIEPFVQQCHANGQGAYILVRTSNPSAGDLQDLELADGRPVYEAMAAKVSSWGEPLIGTSGYSSIGAVVGATWPEQAHKLRQIMPHSLILVPGYGAQGATADDAVASFGLDGQGAIVNASRSLMLAYRKHKMPAEAFADAARQEALAMRQDLQQALIRAGKPIA